MQTRIYGNKIRILDATNPEKMWVRRNAVGCKSDGSVLVLDDTLINRTLLGMMDTRLDDNLPDSIEGINPKARDYQRKDIASMMTRRFTLNRNKPGYGKTFEAIEYCRLKKFKRIMVVAPKSVLQQWGDQFAQWWPETSGCVKCGGEPLNGDMSIFITNYEQLNFRNVAPKGSGKKDLIPSHVWQRCKQWVWDVLIIDESHRIKGPTNQITKAVKDLPAAHKLCLTGTPILNHPDDLWSQLDFLSNTICGRNLWAFKERFCEIEENGFGRKPVGLTQSDSAKELLAQVLSRCTVGGENQSVTEGKNYINVDLRMDPKQRDLYKDIVNLALDALDEFGITVKNAVDQIIKQQQVTTNCCKESFKGSGCTVNPKFDWIKDWLASNEGVKLVVFTKFAEAAEELYKVLTRKKTGTARLYIGSMGATEREKAKKDFINRSEVQVIIGTIGAMGVGVDGFQKVCRDVVFLDRDWTPGINEQAEDRVNRSGQTGMTNVWILSMKNSIDKYVERIQGKKAEDIVEVFKNVQALDCT